MKIQSETFFNPEDFVPSLRQQLETHPLDLTKLIRAGIPVKDPEEHPTLVPAGMERNFITLTDGKAFAFWKVDSLRTLFRGDRKPTTSGDLPEAYTASLLLLELHVLDLCSFLGDRRDAEMQEIYSMLRRRPDGKSLGFAHDFMWQAAALVLGTRVLSQAEFEAIVGRLERSCRTFEVSPGSKNYAATLRATLGQDLTE